MGAEPYSYVVEYQPDPQAALGQLRADVFRRGAYFGSDRSPRSPEEALRSTGETGTRSILDIARIAPQPAHGCAAALSSTELQRYFGTLTPTVAMVEECDQLWDDLERGKARYVVAYDQGEPRHFVFVGYSFD